MLKRTGILWLLLISISCTLYCQDKAQKVRESREKTLKEIEYANKLLEETRGKTKQSLAEIDLINHKLSNRRKYLLGLEVEMGVLDEAMADNMNGINEINNQIERLKQLYAIMVINLYKNKSSHYRVMYFLASENLNQLYKRLRTVKLFNSYLRKKKGELDNLKEELVKRNNKLAELRGDKDTLVKKAKNETVVIQREVNQKTKLIVQLKAKQKDIEEEIRNKEKIARKLENELRKIIEAERKRVKPAGTVAGMTPVEKVISTDFERNEGRLPWPTLRGVITGKYGEHQHPDYKYVKIRNDGIFITTSSGEAVRSVFKGVVSRVFSIPGENYTVIIKHGQFYTLYHNLINVSVKAGQSVEMKEKIGTIFTDEKTRETVLHFQVWKETERRDPELWLAPL